RICWTRLRSVVPVRVNSDQLDRGGEASRGGRTPVDAASSDWDASVRIMWALVPLNPNELTAAYRGRPGVAGHSWARVGNVKLWRIGSIRGFSSPNPVIGAIRPWWRESTALIRLATPAALSKWPMFPLTAPRVSGPWRVRP